MNNFYLLILLNYLTVQLDSSQTIFNLQMDTIRIENVSANQNINDKDNNSNAPWIVALAIGLISALTNIYIIYIQTKKQESIFLRNTEETKRLANETINRNQRYESEQNWENLLRVKLSSFVTSGNKLASKLTASEYDTDSIDNLFIAFEFSKLELKILLNPQNKIQEELNNSIDSFHAKVIKNSDENYLAPTLRQGEEILHSALKIFNKKI